MLRWSIKRGFKKFTKLGLDEMIKGWDDPAKFHICSGFQVDHLVGLHVFIGGPLPSSCSKNNPDYPNPFHRYHLYAHKIYFDYVTLGN